MVIEKFPFKRRLPFEKIHVHFLSNISKTKYIHVLYTTCRYMYLYHSTCACTCMVPLYMYSTTLHVHVLLYMHMYHAYSTCTCTLHAHALYMCMYYSVCTYMVYTTSHVHVHALLFCHMCYVQCHVQCVRSICMDPIRKRCVCVRPCVYICAVECDALPVT